MRRVFAFLTLMLVLASPAAAEVIPEPWVLVLDLEPSRVGSPIWLGDAENVVARDAGRVAMLDFAEPRRERRLVRRYRRRGVRVVGFLPAAEFARRAREFFPAMSEPLPLDVSPSDQPFTASAATGYDGAFHSYEEVAAELHELAERYPQRTRLVSLGKTTEGRDLWALRISRDASLDDPSLPDVLFTGCHHAREWISVEPPMFFARRLLDDYASDDGVRHLLDRTEIWIVPVVNADGLAYSQRSPNNSSDGIRMWRKNRRPIPVGECGSRGGAVGVDLNRNYLQAWRLASDKPCPTTSDDAGASDSPADFQLYRGPAPLSELETQALSTLTANPAYQFRARVDMHNYSQLVLYPWGWTGAASPDHTTLAALGALLAQRLSDVNDIAYTPQRAVALYVATGTSTDHSYAIDGAIASFIWELRPNGCCFYVPESQIDPINRETWAAAQTLIEWTIGPPWLERVEVVQGETTIYRAAWTAERMLEVSERAPRVSPGALTIALQFSKPMPSSLPPAARLRRGADVVEVRAADGAQGWQATVYRGDTWVGEAVVPEWGDAATPWTLSVDAGDAAELALDADAATVAAYVKGTDAWSGYEGGPDVTHVLAPSSGIGPSPAPSPTRTPSRRSTASPTRTRSFTRTRTATRTPVNTRTAAASRTATRTRASTRTTTPTHTRTPSRTRTPTRTPTA